MKPTKRGDRGNGTSSTPGIFPAIGPIASGDWGAIAAGVGSHPAALLLAAALLDFAVGDPWTWPHPVQAIGGWIAACNRAVLVADAPETAGAGAQRPRFSPPVMRALGAGLAIATVGGTGAIAAAIAIAATAVHPLLGFAAATAMLASSFAGRSLRAAAEDVLAPLRAGDLPEARSRLSRYVGRDTADLSEAEVLRAVVETVAENATDGVFAPLLWAIAAGLVWPEPAAIAAAAMAYKAASTLDSMVGYRRDPYGDWGWASARLEDALTWVPCRLSVAAIALLSGQPGRVLARCRRDGPRDPSPNSGWSECAYAAALGVQLGGKNVYGGQVREKPLLGEPRRSLSPEVAREALVLTRRCFLLELGLGWLALAAIG